MRDLLQPPGALCLECQILLALSNFLAAPNPALQREAWSAYVALRNLRDPVRVFVEDKERLARGRADYGAACP